MKYTISKEEIASGNFNAIPLHIKDTFSADYRQQKKEFSLAVFRIVYGNNKNECTEQTYEFLLETNGLGGTLPTKIDEDLDALPSEIVTEMITAVRKGVSFSCKGKNFNYILRSVRNENTGELRSNLK
jgi:hypothetical protein